MRTRFPQNRHGPEPSCSHTMRPQLRQLLMSLCFWARHSQECRPGSTTDSLSCPSLLYRWTNLFFFLVEELPSLSWAWGNIQIDRKKLLSSKMWHDAYTNNSQRTQIVVKWCESQCAHPHQINGSFDSFWLWFHLAHSYHFLFITALSFSLLLGISSQVLWIYIRNQILCHFSE